MESDSSTDTLSDEGTIPAAEESAMDEQELVEYLGPDAENNADSPRNETSSEHIQQGNVHPSTSKAPSTLEEDNRQSLTVEIIPTTSQSESADTSVETPGKVHPKTSKVAEAKDLSDKAETAIKDEDSSARDQVSAATATTNEKAEKQGHTNQQPVATATDADDEASTSNQSGSSSITPTKHLHPPTPHPTTQSSGKKSQRDSRQVAKNSAAKFPPRAGIVWREGAKVEARDFQEKWYAAKILELDSSDNTALVHFEGWNSRYDEWIPMDSERIRCITRHSERKDTRSKAVNKTEHKIGECVFAKWTDCRMYPGKIVAITNAGNYDVLFYDGFRKTVVPINVKTMPEDVQQEYAKAGLLPEVGKKNKFPIKDLAKEIQEKNKIKSPESTKKTRSDSERKSLGEKEKKDLKKEVKKEESADNKSPTEKRRKSTDTAAHAAKKPKTDIKEEIDEKKDCEKEEIKETPAKSTKVSREKTVSPVGKKCEKTTPKSASRSYIPPADTLTTEPPSEEYNCPFEACTKTFRKKSLVEYHVKYYHSDDGTPVQHHRKRKSTVGSEEGDLPPSSRSRSRRRREVRASLDGSSHQSLATEDALSEGDNYTKTTTTEDYQQEVLQSEDDGGEGGTQEGIDRIEKDEVVNCICQINEENGLMIQCDVCLCWQHAMCMEITEETLPVKYVCYVCANPPGVRESCRYLYDQDWIRQGLMHRFSFLPEDRHAKKKARIMEATHSLVGDMIGVTRVLNATKRELSVLSEPENAELKIWSRNLDSSPEKSVTETVVAENCELTHEVIQDIKQEAMEETNKQCIENGETSHDFESSNGEIKTETEPKADNETGSPLQNESETGKPPEVNNAHSENETGENPEVNNAHLESETGENPEVNSVDLERETEITDKMDEEQENPPIKTEENIFHKCSVNLLEHISHLHDGIEEQLDAIEQQVNELEAAEENKNSSILRDVPKVKKTMHQLITDLYKVKRLAMYH